MPANPYYLYTIRVIVAKYQSEPYFRIEEVRLKTKPEARPQLSTVAGSLAKL